MISCAVSSAVKNKRDAFEQTKVGNHEFIATGQVQPETYTNTWGPIIQRSWSGGTLFSHVRFP